MLGHDTLSAIPISAFASTTVNAIIYDFLNSNNRINSYLIFECLIHKFDQSIPNTLYPPPMASTPFADLGVDNTLNPVNLIFADLPLLLRTSNTISATVLNIEGRLTSPFNYQTSIPTPSGTSAIGNIDLAVIELINSDRELDYLLDTNLDGAFFTLKLGGSFINSLGTVTELAYDELLIVYQGVIDNLASSSDKITLTVKNLFSILENQPIQTNFYLGTGGLEGGDNIKDSHKPLVFGRANGIAPVLVDDVSLVYQVHDGSIESILSVKDNGVELTSVGSISDVYSWSPIPGQYVYDLSKGIFRLGAKPAGIITCDVKGDNYLGYYEDTIGLVKKVLRFSTLLDTQIDYISLSTTSIPGICGYYTGGNDLNINQVINDLMLAADGWVGFNNRGQLTVGKYVLPDDVLVVDKVYKSFEVYSINIQNAANPVWKILLNYDRIWTTQQEETLGASLTLETKKRLSSTFRNVTKINYNTKTYYRNAEILGRDTLFLDESDTINQANEILRRSNRKRKVYSLVVDDVVLARKVGDIIQVELIEQYGIGSLPASKKLFVVGVIEDKKSNTVNLRAWG